MRLSRFPLLAAPLTALVLATACAPTQAETRPPPPSPAEQARARAEEAQARAEEARAQAEEAQAVRDAARAKAEADAARRQRSEQISREWQERFAGRSAAAQEAFRSRKFVPGMKRDEVKTLVEYRRALGELLELKRVGEREEIGKKKDTWIYCQPDCSREDQVLGTVTFENDVLTILQSGWVAQ